MKCSWMTCGFFPILGSPGKVSSLRDGLAFAVLFWCLGPQKLRLWDLWGFVDLCLVMWLGPSNSLWTGIFASGLDWKGCGLFDPDLKSGPLDTLEPYSSYWSCAPVISEQAVANKQPEGGRFAPNCIKLRKKLLREECKLGAPSTFCFQFISEKQDEAVLTFCDTLSHFMNHPLSWTNIPPTCLPTIFLANLFPSPNLAIFFRGTWLGHGLFGPGRPQRRGTFQGGLYGAARCAAAGGGHREASLGLSATMEHGAVAVGSGKAGAWILRKTGWNQGESIFASNCLELWTVEIAQCRFEEACFLDHTVDAQAVTWFSFGH